MDDTPVLSLQVWMRRWKEGVCKKATVVLIRIVGNTVKCIQVPFAQSSRKSGRAVKLQYVD